MTYTILLSTSLSAEGLQTLQNTPDAEIIQAPPYSPTFQAELARAHALIVGEDLSLDAAFLDQAPCLKLIGLASASATNIDLDAATRRGIIVMNTPGVDAVTVAEYTFAIMLALLRGVIDAHNDLLDGVWNRDLYIGNQLKGKTLGIIGYGRVGQEVAARAVAFGLDVLITDPYISESRLSGLRAKLVGMDELIRRADIISLHTAVVPEMQGFINAERLNQMKRGVFLVNVKHSSLINRDDLLAALESGQVAGAALDDFTTEEIPHHVLIGHPKILHTQRMRANTHEARQALGNILAPQVLDALRGHDYRNTLNMPFMPGQEYESIAPQMQLGERMGALLHHLGHKGAIERFEINIRGEEMEGLLKPLTVAILNGLLKPRLGEQVNYINAPILAAERGILVTQMKHIAIDSYPNLLACRAVWVDGFELIIAGAIFNQTEPRIVQVDHYRTDFVPTDTLLIIGSYDIPGVIGKVGTFMADHQINIGSWRTSRLSKGGHTLSVISVDEALNEDLLNALRQNDFIRHATLISF